MKINWKSDFITLKIAIFVLAIAAILIAVLIQPAPKNKKYEFFGVVQIETEIPGITTSPLVSYVGYSLIKRSQRDALKVTDPDTGIGAVVFYNRRGIATEFLTIVDEEMFAKMNSDTTGNVSEFVDTLAEFYAYNHETILEKIVEMKNSPTHSYDEEGEGRDSMNPLIEAFVKIEASIVSKIFELMNGPITQPTKP